jgi:hypothetical protein
MYKPRLVPVRESELLGIRERALDGAIDVPHLERIGDTYWADADELRAWRALQTTSGADK